VTRQRQSWREGVAAINHRRLLFLDESGAKTNMTRLYGRAPMGQRVHDSVPHGHWNTTTMIAVVGARGAQAPFVFDGATDAQAFRVYAQHVLAPTLRPGDIVVMDNLSSHKDQAARQVILDTGAQIWDLPPYSPDLNPIEKMWSKIKALLRQARARTLEHLVEAIGNAINAVTPSDIQGWFKSCGYSIN
jgi:transposase